MKKRFNIKLALLILMISFITYASTAAIALADDDTNSDTKITESSKASSDKEDEQTDSEDSEIDDNKTEDTKEDTDKEDEVSEDDTDTEDKEDADKENTEDDDDDKDNEEIKDEDTDSGEDKDSEEVTDDDKDKKEEEKEKKKYTAGDLKYLASIIYCEAGNQSYKSKVAVANVVLNRRNDTESWGHVSTIKQVIYDKKWGVQFTPAYSSVNSMKSAVAVYKNLDDYEGTWKYDTMKSCIKAAKAALKGKTVVPDDYFYFNANIQSSKKKCNSKGWDYKVIDKHIYF